MILILSNEEIDDLLELDESIPILEDSYRELAEGRGAIRLNSDILTFPQTGNEMRRVKMPAAPGNRSVGSARARWASTASSTTTGTPRSRRCPR